MCHTGSLCYMLVDIIVVKILIHVVCIVKQELPKLKFNYKFGKGEAIKLYPCSLTRQLNNKHISDFKVQ